MTEEDVFRIFLKGFDDPGNPDGQASKTKQITESIENLAIIKNSKLTPIACFANYSNVDIKEKMMMVLIIFFQRIYVTPLSFTKFDKFA